MKLARRWLLVAGAVVVLAGAAVAGYLHTRGPGLRASGGAAAAADAAASRAGPALSVSTVRAQQRDVPVQLDASGTVAALNSVDVRPQIGSVVTRVHIREGQPVQAGELLFTLDARGAQANLNQALAQLQKDLAALADAQRQLARSKELFAQGFVAQGAVDTSQAQVDAQAAGVSADRAAVDAARVTLGYSRISATTAGRAGAIPVVAGSTVQANTTTLVTITQLDPIAVSFSLPQRHLPDALQLLRSGGGVVTARLPDNAKSLTGRLQFVDNLVDTASGAVKVKAVFENKTQDLWPGAFVDVRLNVRMLKSAIVVPQAAVIQGERGKTVYVVEAGNKAVPRTVEVLYAAGLDAVVSGVRAGERVVVQGRQNLRPGAVVVERGAASAAAAAGSVAGAGEP